MKKLILLSLSIFLFVGIASAQQDKAAFKKRLNSMRIAFITDKVDLTPDEAKDFWPIYNEYIAKRQDLRKPMTVKGDPDAEIKMTLENEEKLLSLKKEYYNKLKTVIPAEKIVRLKSAEKEFKKEILNIAKQGRKKGRK